MQENTTYEQLPAKPDGFHTGTLREKYPDVVGPLPWRESLASAPTKTVSLPQYEAHTVYTASLRLTLGRTVYWLRAIFAFLFGIFLDIRLPWRHDTPERRAERLYQIIQDLGGSFLKIGQQVGIRIDILPYEYYTALSRLLDEVPPFEFSKVVETVERATQRPLGETFSRFDPKPIGSGSIACVYQAILRNGGHKVAVKVLRPNIGPLIAADFDIMRALFIVLRFLNLLPKFVSFEALDEIHDFLMEEMDFVWEARHQDIFRSFSKDIDEPFFSSPKVYFEYSNKEVIVQDLILGVPLKDLLSIVEHKNVHGLERLRELNIDPVEVSRRLLWVNYYTLWATLFFHADPHPGNIIVLPDSNLIFVDFGAVGSLGSKLRSALQQVYDFQVSENIEGAARIALTLMEPLPAVDLGKMLDDVKFEFQRAAIALSSEGVPWTERTSAQLWFGFFRIARKYSVPLPPAAVRMIRGTMLYDTLAARLNPNLNIKEEYQRYRNDAGIAARERIKDSVRSRVKAGGLLTDDYLRIEQLLKEGEQLVFQAQRLVNNVNYSTLPLIGKLTSTIGSLVGLVFRLIFVWGMPIGVGFIYFFAVDYFSSSLDGQRVVHAATTAWTLVNQNILTQDWYWIAQVFFSALILLSAGRRFFLNLYRLSNNE